MVDGEVIPLGGAFEETLWEIVGVHDRKPASYGKTIWNRLEHVLTEVAEVASIGPVTTVNKVIHLDINDVYSEVKLISLL